MIHILYKKQFKKGIRNSARINSTATIRVKKLLRKLDRERNAAKNSTKK